jgi:acyl carrier protein
MCKDLTLEQFEKAVLVATLEFTQVDVQETTQALEGKIHRTFSDLGMDSLDMVEIIMVVEDELGVYFEDNDLEEFDQKMLAEEAAPFLFKLNLGN